MIIEHSTTGLWVLRDGWPRILGVILIVIAVEAINDYVRFDRPALSIGAVGLVVTAISIFLVFRVGEAYSRWWEARGLWGNIVNASRRFGRQVTTLIETPTDDEGARAEAAALRRELVHRQLAWVNALRLSLRGQDRWEELAPFLDPTERAALSSAANRPTRLLQTQAERLASARRRGLLSDFDMLMLDTSLSALHDAQGGCEKIKHTAFPDHIAWTTQVFAWGLAVLIAIAVIDQSNRIDPIDMIVVPFLMIAFIITDQLGAELRNPFENRQNDTPMTALCRTIEIDLRQQLGEREVPPPIEPVDGVLM